MSGFFLPKFHSNLRKICQIISQFSIYNAELPLAQNWRIPSQKI
ncbi:hypothetical protein BHF72_0756 [Cloacibacterium normanense]|uniref:Uncharacterized protein n=1 Tax=Cloacibacterium normanense TaxID=237258 RepID=A0A1E5UB01_9FLAO|nr:hypothetical protein BHF72_0756 [Cloacibacterium normanense]